MDIKIYFLLFIIYSFIGWLIEIVGSLIEHHKFINRGFLIGPYCPIYGFGCLLMMLLLDKYLYDPIVLFIMAIILFSILEYFTSYIMEKIFKLRWWDYKNYKFNINGRICLETMIPFGIGGCIVMYILNPFFINFLKLIPSLGLYIITIFLFISIIIDMIISFNIIFKFKITAIESVRDNTEEIAKKVKEVLITKSCLYKRLIKAFPKFQARIRKTNKN